MSDQHLGARVRAALDAGEGILRLAPTWVPRSFLMPGGRLKLAPQDLYALGAHRGGIDERWFASTTAAANESAPARRGPELRRPRRRAGSRSQDAVEPHGGRDRSATPIWDKYKKWPVYSQVLRQHGPDPPPHAPERTSRPRCVGQRASPRATISRRSSTAIGNNFPYTFMGLEPGTTKDDVRKLPGALERGRQRHPRSLARPTA